MEKLLVIMFNWKFHKIFAAGICYIDIAGNITSRIMLVADNAVRGFIVNGGDVFYVLSDIKALTVHISA